jgi:hypothetical protein
MDLQIALGLLLVLLGLLVLLLALARSINARHRDLVVMKRKRGRGKRRRQTALMKSCARRLVRRLMCRQWRSRGAELSMVRRGMKRCHGRRCVQRAAARGKSRSCSLRRRAQPCLKRWLLLVEASVRRRLRVGWKGTDRTWRRRRERRW